MTDLDQAAKLRVRDALLAQARAEAHALDSSIQSERSAAELDQDETFNVDDVSQSDQAGDMHGLVARAAEQHAEDVRQIEDLDFSPTSVVRPGAIVVFDDQAFVVGATARSFECDGVSYECVTQESPVFAQIEGLSAGDTFTINGREQVIASVC